MNTCYIVGASEMFGEIKPDENDYIIAADGGYKHLEKIRIVPDIIIGDFDSAEKPTDGKIQCHPVMKDDTDMMLAIKHGFEKGYNQFRIYAGLGGERTDHSIANFQSIAYIAQHGGRGVLVGKNEEFTVINDSEIILPAKDGEFSVFAFGGNAEGVTIRGGLYEAENVDLSPFFPLGVSNKFTDSDVSIGVKKGCLLIKY